MTYVPQSFETDLTLSGIWSKACQLERSRRAGREIRNSIDQNDRSLTGRTFQNYCAPTVSFRTTGKDGRLSVGSPSVEILWPTSCSRERALRASRCAVVPLTQRCSSRSRAPRSSNEVSSLQNAHTFSNDQMRLAGLGAGAGCIVCGDEVGEACGVTASAWATQVLPSEYRTPVISQVA